MTGRRVGRRGVLRVTTRLLALAATGLVAVSGSLAGCAPRPRGESPLRVTTSPAGPDTRLTLYAASHLEINARVAPALELRNHTVIRFRSDRLTADSAYFAGPPSALLVGRHDEVHGTLRASVCEVGARVCRSLVVEI